MDIKNTLLDTKLFSIFIFILIISANFLAEIFPCRLQNVLRSNMIIKHIFGFFTLVFFVGLSSSDENKNLYITIKDAFLLYILFILISKCNISLFYIIMIFLGITYIINILKDEENEKIKKDNNDKLDEKEINNRLREHNNKINIYNNITYILYILIIVLIIIGVLIYMGEKKIEYKNNFKYFTFFMGKPSCIGKSPDTNFINSLKIHFKY